MQNYRFISSLTLHICVVKLKQMIKQSVSKCVLFDGSIYKDNVSYKNALTTKIRIGYVTGSGRLILRYRLTAAKS